MGAAAEVGDPLKKAGSTDFGETASTVILSSPSMAMPADDDCSASRCIRSPAAMPTKATAPMTIKSMCLEDGIALILADIYLVVEIVGVNSPVELAVMRPFASWKISYSVS